LPNACRAQEQKYSGQQTEATQEQVQFGKPILVAPRLGQGTFRALVNRCL